MVPKLYKKSTYPVHSQNIEDMFSLVYNQARLIVLFSAHTLLGEKSDQ